MYGMDLISKLFLFLCYYGPIKHAAVTQNYPMVNGADIYKCNEKQVQ